MLQEQRPEWKKTCGGKLLDKAKEVKQKTEANKTENNDLEQKKPVLKEVA